MKPLFYFFGLGREGKLFALKDPIVIDSSGIFDLYEYSPEILLREKGLKLEDYIEGYRYDRGVLFGVAKSAQKLSQFLRLGKLLSPDIIGRKFSVYFLNQEKGILFKINKINCTWKDLRKEVWEVIEPLKIISKASFSKLLKDWKGHETCHESFCLETSKFKLYIGRFYYSFVYLKPKNYVLYKNKTKKAHADNR